MTPASHARSSNRPYRQIWCLGTAPWEETKVLSHCCRQNPAFLEPPRRWHLRWFPQQAAIQDPWLGYMAVAARTEAVAKKGLRHQSRHDLGL
ncbi:unnamed protein product [Miscanthus lutarioriparius]|uniref:Uncharacterized protein n=1 Tax=Miscanthus lutarioriparius TaxID=422564 RepID=A0A811RCX6_9POAL|nr:unnamed protein product [Miscanthus lutarioriparius]